MKKILFTIILLWVGSNSAISQSNSIGFSFKPRLFSLRNAQLHGGLSYEIGLGENTTSEEGPLLYNFYKKPENITFIDSVKHYGITASLDLYAPNSRLGFCLDLNFISNQFSLTDKNNSRVIEKFSIGTLNTPLYLKFRTGSVESTTRTVLMIGYAFSIPIYVTRENLRTGESYEDRNQALSGRGFSFIIGQEIVLSKLFDKNYERSCTDGSRLLFYAKLNLRNSSLLNTSYSTDPLSILGGKYDDQDFRDYQLLLGIRLLGRFTKCKR